MDWWKCVAVGLGLLLLSWSPGWAEEAPLGGAWISAVEGEAQVHTAEESGWKPAPPNMPLLPGDRLQMGAGGRSELLFASGTAVRLGPGSSATLVAIPPAEAQQGDPAEIVLEAGSAILTAGDGDRSRPGSILITPGARVQVYPRSRVRADAVAIDASDLVLREGAAAVDTLGTTIPLRVGEGLRVIQGGAYSIAAPPHDDLDGWADSRERFASGPPSAPYVPPSLAPHAGDLTIYGEWITAPEYGYVWRPTTVVTGWAPFTDGRWVWRGGTWVWLPREPWGWIPFHYGRWRWHPRLHWFWVPPPQKVVAWCPGAVAWIQMSSHVAWVPLAPGEIYYGSRGSRVPHTTVVNVTHVTIHKTFVNAGAPAAVVAVPAHTFKTSTVVGPTIARLNLRTLGTPRPAPPGPGPAGPGVSRSHLSADVERPRTHQPPGRIPSPTESTRMGAPTSQPPGVEARPPLGDRSTREPRGERNGPPVGNVASTTAPTPPFAPGHRQPRDDARMRDLATERSRLRAKSRDARPSAGPQASAPAEASAPGQPTQLQRSPGDRNPAAATISPLRGPARHRNQAPAVASPAPLQPGKAVPPPFHTPRPFR